MTEPRRSDRFPRPVLFAVGGMMAFTILVAGIGRLTHATVVPANGVVVQQRDLRFTDQEVNGADNVVVTDAATGAVIQTVTGQAGFLRGTIRGLASARLRAGQGAEAPFRLTLWKDGRLTLDDPDNGRHVELEAFGPANEAVFAALLDQAKLASPSGGPQGSK